MITEKDKQWAIRKLQQRAEELKSIPRKSDFNVEDFSRIKAFLGPWPRALEAAGLKNQKPQKNNNSVKSE